MRWEDELWVKQYRRDPPELLTVSLLARGIWHILWKEVDRGGRLDLGKMGRRTLAAILRAPSSELETPINELVDAGCIEFTDQELLIPVYLEAQAAKQSNSARCRKYRQQRNDDTERDASDTPRVKSDTPGDRDLSIYLSPLSSGSGSGGSGGRTRGPKKVVKWSEDVIRVWSYGVEVLKWASPRTSSALADIDRRLKEGYTVEQCCRAIDGVLRPGCWQYQKGARSINAIFSRAVNLDQAIAAGSGNGAVPKTDKQVRQDATIVAVGGQRGFAGLLEEGK